MNLQPLVSVDRLRLDVPVRSKKHAIEVAATCLADDLDGVTSNRVFDALIARERLGCTTLRCGVALPHAAIENVSTSLGCVIKFAEPIAFDDDDPVPVSLILALVVPAQTQCADNDDLQRACDFLTQSDNRRALLAATTPSQLHAALAVPDSGMSAGHSPGPDADAGANAEVDPGAGPGAPLRHASSG